MLFGNDLQKIEKLAAKGKNEKLVHFLKSKNKETRMAALKVIESANCEEAYNTLIGMMHCEDVEERIAVLTAIGKSKNPGAITSISYDLQKENNKEVADAMRSAIVNLRSQTK